MHNLNKWCYVFVLFWLFPNAQASAAAPWTLEASVQRALELAPELREGEARIAASRAAMRQAGAWPNPALELRADDRLGLELDRGGRDITSVGITQPLPLGQIGPRRHAAEAAVMINVTGIDETRLAMEFRAAAAFHRLQRAQATLDLARQAAAQAGDFAGIGKRRAEAGDIARRELLRLELLAAQARQAIEEAEGEWSEAAAGLAVLLDLEPESLGRIAPFEPPSGLPALEYWFAAAEAHPALRRDRAKIDSVQAERRIARSERLPRFGIVVYREYEAISGAREAVTGAGLNVELPLWDRRNGRLDELTARGEEIATHLQGQRRVRLSDVRMRYLHLTHLLEQSRSQEVEVLAPAREVLALTRQAYDAGEVDLPALIDAAGTARDAEATRQSLLFNAWQELAHLRADAGVFLGSLDKEMER